MSLASCRYRVCSAAFLLPLIFAQAQSNPGVPRTSQSAPVDPTQADSGVLTFHVTTREVILELTAVNGHGGHVADLARAELQVSYAEEADKAHKHGHSPASAPQIALITSLRVVDPNVPLSSPAGVHAGFRITSSCLERSTIHYQLAFRPGPDGWTSGFHTVSVTTTRRDVRLFYRHHYFVGKTIAPREPPVTDPHSIEKLLMKDACYYPDTPLSISLRGRLIDSGREDVLRYQVAVDAGSLSYLTLEAASGSRPQVGVDRRVQIDYGICTFNGSGRPIQFFRAPLDQVLTSVDYARALDHGFPHLFEIPALPSLALTRVVVRDRATGNVGATDIPLGVTASGGASGSTPVATNNSADAGASAQDRLARETARDLDLSREFDHGIYVPPPQGPIGSFGSVVPAVDSFCGDVYELDHVSSRLPDFRELDPIGSLYTYSLDVPSQDFTNTDGIPGVTPRTNLFGIDYHAMFWIRNAGEYRFRLVSDDGAMLWIDDRRLVDVDGVHSALGANASIHLEEGPHTIHVPYYQGAVVSVALLLWVQPPGEKDWQIFDLHNFAPPSSSAH